MQHSLISVQAIVACSAH